jgi:hypothetical protein
MTCAGEADRANGGKRLPSGRFASIAQTLFVLTLGLWASLPLADRAHAEEDYATLGYASLGTIRFDDTRTMPIIFDQPGIRADGSARLFLWPSEEPVDGATRLLTGQPYEQYDEEIRLMTQVMLGERQERKYNSTLKEIALAPLALKAMLEPDIDFFGIPASCHGKASFSGAYAGCSLKW